MAAARPCRGAADSCLRNGKVAVVVHVAEHDLGAAAYALEGRDGRCPGRGGGRGTAAGVPVAA